MDNLDIQINDIENQINNVDMQTVCQQFAQILGGEIVRVNEYSCTIRRPRNLIINILGKQSKEATNAIVTFESLDVQGTAINYGDIALLPEEVGPFVFILLQNGIIVSAVSNRWVFSDPQIVYVHFESIDDPLSFAIKVADALLLLR